MVNSVGSKNRCGPLMKYINRVSIDNDQLVETHEVLTIDTDQVLFKTHDA